MVSVRLPENESRRRRQSSRPSKSSIKPTGGTALKTLLLVFLSLTLCAAGAFAGTVYSFTGTYTNYPPGAPSEKVGPVSFTLTVPHPITADVTYYPGSELVCSDCDHIGFLVNAFLTFGWDPAALVGYSFAEGSPCCISGANFLFDLGTFVTNGTHDSVIFTGINDAVLVVSGAPDGAETPEPSTIALLTVPLLAGLACLRKRRLTNNL